MTPIIGVMGTLLISGRGPLCIKLLQIPFPQRGHQNHKSRQRHATKHQEASLIKDRFHHHFPSRKVHLWKEIRFKKTQSAFCAVHKPIFNSLWVLPSRFLQKKTWQVLVWLIEFLVKNKISPSWKPLSNSGRKGWRSKRQFGPNSLSFLVKVPKFHKIGANLGPLIVKHDSLKLGWWIVNTGCFVGILFSWLIIIPHGWL